MANDNDHFADFVIAIAVMGLSLVVLVFLIKVLFHFIFSLIPLFLFYLVPFALASFLFALLFSWPSALFTPRNVDFRLLSVIIPFLGFILYGAVGIPQTQWHAITIVKETSKKPKAKKPQEKEDKPQVTQTVERITQWPRLEALYQRVENRLDLEKKFVWQDLTYDRPNLAAVLWLALFLGGPLGFWIFFADAQQADEDERFQKSIKDPLMKTLT
jgi:predicted membrane protein